jgi:SAM-dependent methyltransferase
VNENPCEGRYNALKKALKSQPEFIHYVDMDRLLHWVETRPEDWKQAIEKIDKYDCVIFGRTQTATLTHPQAMITTEKSSNQVVSHFLKREMDVSAGSKSFSRSAAQYLVDHGQPDNSIGTDAEWPLLLKQAGFKVEYILVEGLDWESADRFQLRAATTEEQKHAAQEYDSDPLHWSQRVEIAREIIQTTLEVTQKELPAVITDSTQLLNFDLEAVFDVDDYLYFYSEMLTGERTDAEVSALVRLLALDKPKKILDLACGFGRHTNRLAALGYSMTGVDLTPGFLDVAIHEAEEKHLDVRYVKGDMRTISYKSEFDCILLLFTAFGYFSDEENLQVLINARNALLPGGRLIFDIANRDTFLKTMQPYYVVEKEGNLMIDRTSFDGIQGRSYNRRVVIRDGIRKEKPFSIRLYNPNEIQALIARSGLELEHMYAGWDGSELTSNAQRMILIVRKP